MTRQEYHAFLQASQVSLSVKGRHDPILHHFDITLNKGDFVAVVGHNGSGKSSLLKLLSGQIPPTRGRITFNGISLSHIVANQHAKDFLTLSQHPEEKLFLDMTLLENITLWESRFPKHRRVSPQDICNLTHRATHYHNRLNQLMGNLSGGEKQAFLLALTLAHPPQILFLDEHTSALDPKAATQVMKLTHDAIVEHSMTVLMVTHRLDDALKYGNRLVVLREGKIIMDQIKSTTLTLNDIKNAMD